MGSAVWLPEWWNRDGHRLIYKEPYEEIDTPVCPQDSVGSSESLP